MALSRTWQELERRPDDGYFDATAAGSIFQKHPKHFLGTSQTKAYIVAVAKALHLDTGFDETPNKAVVVVQYGGTAPGTWFHPRLMLHYARWLDPHFAMWMDSWVIDVLEGQRLVAAKPAPEAQTVARRQEVARPQPLYRNRLCILNKTDAWSLWASRRRPRGAPGRRAAHNACLAEHNACLGGPDMEADG